jgi:hypothetical protein
VCLGDAIDDCQAESDTCVVAAYASGAALERLGECRDQLWGELLAGVLDGEHHTLERTLVVTHTVPCSGRLWTIALCTRFVVICSRSARKPKVGAMSPELWMLRPRFSARGRSVSVASSAMRDKSTCSRVKDRWSARRLLDTLFHMQGDPPAQAATNIVHVAGTDEHINGRYYDERQPAPGSPSRWAFPIASGRPWRSLRAKVSNRRPEGKRPADRPSPTSTQGGPMPQEIHDRRTVQALMDAGAQVVEVLPRDEFEEDHLPGAIHISLSAIETEALRLLDPSRPVVVYCWDSA